MQRLPSQEKTTSPTMKVSGQSLSKLLHKKVVDTPEKDVIQLLNDYDLDAGEILSWLHGNAETEVLFPKHERDQLHPKVRIFPFPLSHRKWMMSLSTSIQLKLISGWRNRRKSSIVIIAMNNCHSSK